jgi:hypothetical protein
VRKSGNEKRICLYNFGLGNEGEKELAWRGGFSCSDLAIYLAIFEVIKVQPSELATVRVKLVGCSDRR